MRVGYVAADGGSFLDFGLGGHLGLVRNDFPAGTLEVTARGLISSRFRFGSRSFDLRASDFIGGLGVSYGGLASAVELLVSHLSSHLGDSGLNNHSLERFRLLYSAAVATGVRAYGGLEMPFRSDPSFLRGRSTFIVGGDWHFYDSFFLALDVRSRQENDWALSSSLVVGTELGDSAQASRQRIFLELYDGNASLGQYFRERDRYVMIGAGFTL